MVFSPKTMTTKKPPLPADYGDATPEQVAKAVGRFKRDQDERMSKFNRVAADRPVNPSI